MVVSSFGIPEGGDEDLNVRLGLLLLYIFLFLEDVEDAGMELDNAVALGLVDWLDNAAGVSSVAAGAVAEAEADARALGLVDWVDNAAGISSVAAGAVVAEAEADARALGLVDWVDNAAGVSSVAAGAVVAGASSVGSAEADKVAVAAMVLCLSCTLLFGACPLGLMMMVSSVVCVASKGRSASTPVDSSFSIICNWSHTAALLSRTSAMVAVELCIIVARWPITSRTRWKNPMAVKNEYFVISFLRPRSFASSGPLPRAWPCAWYASNNIIRGKKLCMRAFMASR